LKLSFSRRSRAYPTNNQFTLRQVSQTHTDFAVIEAELEAIHAHIVHLPTRKDLTRTALMGLVGGACLVRQRRT